jgi:hypothetical protein
VTESAQLVQLGQAERMLAECATVEEALNIVDYAAAARDFAKRARLGAQSINHAMVIRLKAERRMAELVDQGQQAGTIETPGGSDKIKMIVRSPDNENDQRPSSLESLGVKRQRLDEARKLAALTDQQLTEAAERATNQDVELTRTSLLKEAARIRVPEPAITPAPADVTTGLYRAVVIDPPWPMQKIERDERPTQGSDLDYPTMPVWCDKRGDDPRSCWQHWVTWTDFDEPDEEPGICQSIECTIGQQLAATADNDGCHIYLWTTHRFLPDSIALFDRLGITYQCLMTWRKNVGITPFSWMYDTEHVLFGRLGSLKLERLGLRLSFDAPVTGHSVKPDVFYDRVLAASPSPRLDMFARRPREGFAVWGNEVAS